MNYLRKTNCKKLIGNTKLKKLLSIRNSKLIKLNGTGDIFYIDHIFILL